MSNQLDDFFYDRADAHIRLSNEQISGDVGRGKVSASMLFSAARFNAWVSACGFGSRADMAVQREQTIKYFVDQYRGMLEENLDDYIEHFDQYILRRGSDT